MQAKGDTTHKPIGVRTGDGEARPRRRQNHRVRSEPLLLGGGGIGDVLRARDWAATPLGPIAHWPPPLRTILGSLLGATVPMAVCWGPKARVLYNDGFRAIVGTAHPGAFGEAAQAAFAGLWPTVESALASALAGRAAHVRIPPVPGEPAGGAAGVSYDLGFSPVPLDDGRIGGALVIASEAQAGRTAEEALRESETRLRLAQEAAGIGVYERNLETGMSRWSPDMFRVWGLDPAGRSPWVSDDEYMSRLVSDDEVMHRGRRDSLRSDPSVFRFENEFRIRRADTGEVRWLSSRGEYVRDASGRAVMVRGTTHDVTERREAEERQALLMREVDHRAKNALAVVQSIVRLTPAEDPEAFKAAVLGRIAALARAQTVLAGDRWSGADLRTLLRGELHPFEGVRPRVTLTGPDFVLPPGAAQPLAMAAHELATNAIKHGAFSTPEGRVCVAWEIVQDAEVRRLRLRWAELGGPPVAGPPARRGFGTRVLDGTVRHQLRGTVALTWAPSGLVCEVAVPLTEGRAWTMGARAHPG